MNRIRSVDSISIFDRIFDPQIELPLQGRIILFWDRIFDMQIEILEIELISQDQTFDFQIELRS